MKTLQILKLLCEKQKLCIWTESNLGPAVTRSLLYLLRNSVMFSSAKQPKVKVHPKNANFQRLISLFTGLLSRFETQSGDPCSKLHQISYIVLYISTTCSNTSLVSLSLRS